MARKPTPLKRYREGVLVTGRKGDRWVRGECVGHAWELTSRVYTEDGQLVQDARCLVCLIELTGIMVTWWQELASLNYVLSCDVTVANRIRALQRSQDTLRRRQAKLSPREALEGF